MTADEKPVTKKPSANSLANLKPLKVTEGMTEEEKQRQHEIRVKGGKARSEQAKATRTMKEQLNIALSTKVSKEVALGYIGDIANGIAEEDLNLQTLLLMSAFREAFENGNVKAMEFVRDTVGQAPKMQLQTDLQADIVTATDRQLIENIRKRLGVNQEEDEKP